MDGSSHGGFKNVRNKPVRRKQEIEDVRERGKDASGERCLMFELKQNQEPWKIFCSHWCNNDSGSDHHGG